MRLKGRVWQDEDMWLIECPAIGAVTQGFSKKHALQMLVDYIQCVVDIDNYRVEVYAEGEVVTIVIPDPTPLAAYVAKQIR